MGFVATTPQMLEHAVLAKFGVRDRTRGVLKALETGRLRASRP
jgi:hypothetical protein